MNKALIRRVALKLRRLRHEEHYNQNAFLTKTQCGTVACIAGHIVLELGYHPIPKSEMKFPDRTFFCRKGKEQRLVVEVAAKAIGTNEDSWLWEPEPTYNWPEPFSLRWQTGRERRSRIAADLLDAIADGKVEP